MQKYSVLILLLFCISCVNQQEKKKRFTDEQISSLYLDSTKIISVKTDSVITVDLNPFLKKQNFDFGSMVKEVKLIPLETTDDSLLDDIYKVLVTDSNIYIMDGFKGRGIVVFDIEGKFVRRISNGQGPGELVRLYDIAYDTEGNELIAYQHSFLLFFSPSGQFLRQMRLPFGFYNFTVIPDGYVFKALDEQGNEHLGALEYFTLFVTDKNFKLKSVALPLLSNVVNYGGYSYLYNNNNEIRVTQKFTDTVYQYINETNALKAKYALDYSKKKLPKRYVQGSIADFDNGARQNDYYYYLGEYLETEHHHAFFLMNDYTGLKTIIYRDKKTGNRQGGTHGNSDDAEIPPMGFPIATSDNYFISCHFPDTNDFLSLLSNSSVISDEDKKKIKDLKEDDNPVLVFFKLDNF